MRSSRNDTHLSTTNNLLSALCRSFIHFNFLAIASDETVRPLRKRQEPPLTKPIVKLDLTPVSVRSAHRKTREGEGMLPCRPNQVGNAQSL